MKNLLVVFGKPGAGKSFIAEIFRDTYGYSIHNSDDDLPKDMKRALQNTLPITDTMRKQFLKKIIESTQTLTKQHIKLIIDQTFLKEFMRVVFLENFPNAQFVLVESDDKTREDRYMKRNYFNLGLPYLRHMSKLFEAPQIPHLTIYNNNEGTKEIELQIKNLIRGNL
jgi:gluconate kinase